MWVDEIARAAFGFVVCWPALWACEKMGVKAGLTALLLTAYMIPAWRAYAWLAGWLI